MLIFTIPRRGRSRSKERAWVPKLGCVISDHNAHPESSTVFAGGNEGGVGGDQTFDRVESGQAAETRAARCEYRPFPTSFRSLRGTLQLLKAG